MSISMPQFFKLHSSNKLERVDFVDWEIEKNKNRLIEVKISKRVCMPITVFSREWKVPIYCC